MLSQTTRRLMARQQVRAYTSISKSGIAAAEAESPVLIYDSPEFNSFSGASAQAGGSLPTWDSQIMASPHKAKFFSLLPFQIESVSYLSSTLTILLEIH